MDQDHIFSATLGLAAPWKITTIRFTRGEKRLDISINYHAEQMPQCPICGLQASSCSAKDETWHHSDFFRFAAFLHARVPVVECPYGCGSSKVPVPWERSGSKFILLDGEEK